MQDPSRVALAQEQLNAQRMGQGMIRAQGNGRLHFLQRCLRLPPLLQRPGQQKVIIGIVGGLCQEPVHFVDGLLQAA